MTWGGAEMLLSELAQACPPTGVRMTVAYLSDYDGSPAVARLRAHGVEPVLVPMTKLYDPRGILRMRAHLARLRPDLVHTHLGNADLVGAAAARMLGIPVVSTLHVMEWDRRGREDVKERLMALARRTCSDRVITVSRAARIAYLEQRWDRPGHVVIVHNGVAAQWRPGAGRALRAELGLQPDDLVAAMVTVLRPGKGHEVAAAALAQLRDVHPRLRLLVAGDGPGRAEVARALAPLGPVAVMAGHRDDVGAVLDASDVLIHPTRVDAFPTTLLEAMAAGLPVVATAVGGIPEIVDRSSGLLLDPPAAPAALAAALDALLTDPELRRRMGEAGRRRYAEQFSAERWAGRLRALYDEVLAT
jgi:glycosyltransferase involved in cell wall biosynthesis